MGNYISIDVHMTPVSIYVEINLVSSQKFLDNRHTHISGFYNPSSGLPPSFLTLLVLRVLHFYEQVVELTV